MRAGRSYFAAFLLAFAVMLTGGCSRQEEYPQAVRDEFLAGCIPAAKERVTSTVSDPAELERLGKAYCECSLTGVMKAFSLKEFVELETVMNMGAQLDAATAKKLSAAISECQIVFQPKK